jgi:hypothetical protein
MAFGSLRYCNDYMSKGSEGDDTSEGEYQLRIAGEYLRICYGMDGPDFIAFCFYATHRIIRNRYRGRILRVGVVDRLRLISRARKVALPLASAARIGGNAWRIFDHL